MVTCQNCGNEQTEGNFCESCGTKLLEQHSQAIADEQTIHQKTASHPTMDKVKKGSEQYWNYVLTRLKNPSKSLQDNETTFNHALLTAILFPLAVALFFFGIIDNIWKDTFGIFTDEKLPFFPIIIRVLFVMLSLFISGLIANWITLKISKITSPFKTLFNRYIGLQVPIFGLFILLALLALIGIVKINLYDFEFNFWVFAFILLPLLVVIFINPLIHCFYHLVRDDVKQSYYLSLLSLLLNIIIIVILIRVFIADILETLDRFY
ncbi:zinc ribbon domain-containing protein [Bacillus sp. JCM 19034]|uniref:zinc ribbon domain-containing protein n=1 Tax=Bacillus sp. JCM 19034 TaxID=1481928 RepID=UPI0007802CEA|nr:zinc ribbon domain-containing protein [Bacillus sp. JCM 19034]